MVLFAVRGVIERLSSPGAILPYLCQREDVFCLFRSLSGGNLLEADWKLEVDLWVKNKINAASGITQGL